MTAWATENRDYTVKTWGIENGLPQSTITSIAQTPDGYLWLGTFNGLARFDGVRFTVFDAGNTHQLASSRITRLDIDWDGGLWIIAEDGELANLVNGRFRQVCVEDGLPAAGAAAVIRGPGRRLLLLDRAGGVSRFQSGRWRIERNWEFLEGHRASFFTDGDGRAWAWLRDNRTFGQIVDNRLVVLRRPDGLAAAQVRSFALGSQHRLWMVLGTEVWLFQSQRQEWQSTDWHVPEAAHGLTAMLEDSRGDLWLSTYGYGLLRFTSSNICQRFTAGENLSHNVVRALLEDREGNLWVGTDGGGLNRLKPRVVTTFDKQHGLTGEIVTSITPSREGSNVFWVALNGGGVNRLELPRVTPLVAEPLLETNSFVYGILEDREGGLWIGSYDQGILRYRAGRISRVSATAGEGSGKPLLAVLEDSKGIIWLAGGFGLFQEKDQGLVNLNLYLGGSNVVVRALAEDRAGNVYVGSFGKGLFRYFRDQWHRHHAGLADPHVSSLYVDSEDRLWIGTFNGGLSRFANGRFVNCTIEDGLPANCITGITEDDLGNLWLSSNSGLHQIPKAELNEFADGRRRRVNGYSYGLDDGLHTLECGGGAQPAACKGPDGRLWFATVRGVAMVEPAKLRKNTAPPHVVVEELLVDGQALDLPRGDSSPAPGGENLKPRSEAIIPARHGRVELRFTGLSFVAPENVRFRYRLKGYDTAWIAGRSERTASYTHLPAGEYQFQVTACNNDGIWNETGAEVPLVVLSLWWNTWAFRAIVIAGAGGMLYWLIQLRLWRLQHERLLQRGFARRLINSQEAERKRLAAELHDGVGQDLLAIKNWASLGLRNAAKFNPVEQLDQIGRLASQSLEQVREISHNLRPHQIDRLGLLNAIESMVQTISESSGIRCITTLKVSDGFLAQAAEIHLYRVVQELLSNIIKHSAASQAQISLVTHNSTLILSVEDDGRGFDYPAVLDQRGDGHGLGLTDIAERVRLLGGRLHCYTRKGQGTCWRIEIPARATPENKTCD